MRVAFFTDSFHEVNGVAHTSRMLTATAERLGVPFQVVCAVLTMGAACYDEVVTIFTLPTASGKTFIMAMAANAFAHQFSVTVLVPDNLVAQTKTMLEPLCKKK